MTDYRATTIISDERLHELDLWLSEIVAEIAGRDGDRWADLYDAIGELKARRFMEAERTKTLTDILTCLEANIPDGPNRESIALARDSDPEHGNPDR